MSDNALSLYNYDASKDFDDLEQEDLITPRLIVAQAGKKVVKQRLVEDGCIYVHGTNEVIMPYGGSIDIVVFAKWKEYVEWNPDRKAEKKQLDRSTDPNGRLAQLNKVRATVINSEGKKVPRVQCSWSLLVCVPAHDWYKMFIWSFKGSHFKVAKGIINTAKGLKWDPENTGTKVACPLCCCAYSLNVKLEDNGDDSWNEPVVIGQSFVDKEQAAFLLPMSIKAREGIEAMRNANSAFDEDAEYDADAEVILDDSEV